MNPMEKGYSREQWHKDNTGITIFEDVEGRFTQSFPQKIRLGVQSVELQLGLSAKTGPETYGKEARQEIKKLAELSGVDIHSIHSPVQVQGLAGFNPQGGGFNEDTREAIFNEIAKVVDFAADTTKGSNIVVHLGEFPRSLSAQFPEFESTGTEHEEAQIYFGDRETGQVQRLARDTPLMLPDRNDDGTQMSDPHGHTELKRKTWFDFHDDLERMQREYGTDQGRERFRQKYGISERYAITDPDEKRDLATAALQSEWVQTKVDRERAQLERWRAEYENAKDVVDQLRPRRPREGSIEARQLRRAEREMNSAMRLLSEEERTIGELERYKQHMATIKDLALPRTADTLAKSAIVAMERTQQFKLERPIVIVPENLSPREYGSHPDEMVEVVESARKAMVDRLTKQMIQDPTGRVDSHGNIKQVENPYYQSGLSEEKARTFAENHIKATLDTQHLQMWMQHYKRKPGQTEQGREKDFSEWYGKEMHNLLQKDVVGHVHVVDGFGRGHVHLPLGQGRLMDFSKSSEAIDELRSMGLAVIHEGWLEGPTRQVTEMWKATNKPIYGLPGGDTTFSALSDKYLGGVDAPPYLFGEIATDRDDYHLWSEVPLE